MLNFNQLVYNCIAFISTLTIPLTSCIHVRAKNVNGWSQWSNYGYIIAKEKLWDDEVFVWLYYHSLEQYHARFVEYGIRTIEEIMKLSSSEISSKISF